MSWLRRKLKQSFGNKKEAKDEMFTKKLDELDELSKRYKSNLRLEDEVEDENRTLCRSQSIHAQVQEDDGLNANPYMRRSQSISSLTRNSQQNRDKRISVSLQQRPEDEDPNLDQFQLRTPRTNEELIQLMDLTIRRFRPPKPEGVYDESDDVNRPKAGNDGGYVYIEEALKGPQMNPIWRRKIFSQRPEDDDEELRELVESRLKHYSPHIVDDYRSMHRYAALEEREYKKDIMATGGFEVGHYPYMARAGFNAIHRFYCPPDASLPNHGITHLCGLAHQAIQVFNSKEQTNFYLVKVIKTMTLPAAGCWFFITFQASLPCYGDQLWTFEASVFEGIHRDIRVDSVRLNNMVAGPSGVIVEEPQACCSSNTFSPYAG